MNYVILNYFEEGSITHSAIIFGKNNLKLIHKDNIFNIYKVCFQNNTFYLPVKSNNEKLKLGEESLIFNQYSDLSLYKKIIFLPSIVDKEICNHFKNETLISISFQGDPCSIEYDSNVKIISCVKPNGEINNKLLFDIKLCLPFFYYKHQLSLVDFDKIKYFKNINPKDKLFFYSRRTNEFKNDLRDRAYFTDKVFKTIHSDYTHIENKIHKNIELSRISYGLYHLANYFDYNCSMFNLIFESQHVDFEGETQTWISEKSLFGILLSNPFFLFANPFILKSLKELGVELLNDEFEGNDIEEKFNNFCKLFGDNKVEDRKKLYLKMSEKQIENRKKVLDYIYSPKIKVIEFLIN